MAWKNGDHNLAADGCICSVFGTTEPVVQLPPAGIAHRANERLTYKASSFLAAARIDTFLVIGR